MAVWNFNTILFIQQIFCSKNRLLLNKQRKMQRRKRRENERDSESWKRRRSSRPIRARKPAAAREARKAAAPHPRRARARRKRQSRQWRPHRHVCLLYLCNHPPEYRTTHHADCKTLHFFSDRLAIWHVHKFICNYI